MIEEDGKYYPMMKAVKSEHGFSNFDKTLPQGESSKTFWQQMEDRYGPLLLQRKHPVLYRYLEREARICDEVLCQLQVQGTEGPKKSRRYEEISRQKRNCLRVMRERYGDGYGEDSH